MSTSKNQNLVGRPVVFDFPRFSTRIKALKGPERLKELEYCLGTNYAYLAARDGRTGEIVSVSNEDGSPKLSVLLDDGTTVETYTHDVSIGKAPVAAPTRVPMEFLDVTPAEFSENHDAFGRDCWTIAAATIDSVYLQRPLLG